MVKQDVDWLPPFISSYVQPVTDNARSISAVEKQARKSPGASAVTTMPQPVETQPQVRASALANAAARRAEKAVRLLEDSKIILARLQQQGAPEDQITEANLQVTLHKLLAVHAVKQNVQLQTKLRGAAERRRGEAEAALENARSNGFKNPASIKLAEEKYNSASWELSRCSQEVAEALTLLDIAEGVRSGRGELAEDKLAQEVSLADAQRTERELDASLKELAILDEPAGADRFGQSTKRRCEDDFHAAASANLATWLALYDNVKGGPTDLRKTAEAGLKRGKEALAFDP